MEKSLQVNYHPCNYIMSVVLYRYFDSMKKRPEVVRETITLKTPFVQLYQHARTPQEREALIHNLRETSAKLLGIPSERLSRYEEGKYANLGDLVADLKNMENGV